MRYASLLLGLLLAACTAPRGGEGAQTGGGEGAFIRTALVLYGRFGQSHPGDCYPLAEAARFHLVEMSPSSYNTRWCEVRNNRELNAHHELKRLNPQVRILIYQMGPGQLIVSRFDPVVQEEWEWIKREHGRGSPDRWAGLGARTGEYLRALPYPAERAMVLGNSNWQRHWMESRHHRLWGAWGQPGHQDRGGRSFDSRGADGIFLDGMQYGVSWQSGWCPESLYDEQNNRCGERDHPADYYLELRGVLYTHQNGLPVT
ncbi:hypothetical protein DV704_10300 [Meiothermus sp. QL-1]|uniref:hypothetical protein n=1 Tax=Meiothermus sp. QL-1 TaxID=2058095 RepID=UPI000E0BF8E6|nr:hypothetical protein [Meiothermus sp. QL-1]RDI94853.1 hypothetical protein DV704_10300 [Meiothermus sp. QL-1]